MFALLSAMAYGGLRSVLDADHATAVQAEELGRLQQAMKLITRDIGQIVERSIRDGFGDPQPALDGTQEQRLELTRAGWSNPTKRRRSNLQRVAYRQEGTTLMREIWLVLDRAQDSEPYRTELLEGVRSVRFRYLDREREWRASWPPQLEQLESPPLPLAVELTLELEKWGTITRLVPLSGGA